MPAQGTTNVMGVLIEPKDLASISLSKYPALDRTGYKKTLQHYTASRL